MDICCQLRVQGCTAGFMDALSKIGKLHFDSCKSCSALSVHSQKKDSFSFEIKGAK